MRLMQVLCPEDCGSTSAIEMTWSEVVAEALHCGLSTAHR